MAQGVWLRGRALNASFGLFFLVFSSRFEGFEGFKMGPKRQADKQKFEEIRQFFYYHQTNGFSMTHCSLRGSTDTFTDTGKWFFPDTWRQTLKMILAS